MKRAVALLAGPSGTATDERAIDDAEELQEPSRGFPPSDFPQAPSTDPNTAASVAGVVGRPNSRLRGNPLFARGALVAAGALTALGRSVRQALGASDAPASPAAADDEDDDSAARGKPRLAPQRALRSPMPTRAEWLESHAAAFLAAFGLAGRRSREAANDAQAPSRGKALDRRERRQVVPALPSMAPVQRVVKPAAVRRHEPPRGWRLRRTLAWSLSLAGATALASMLWVYMLPTYTVSSSDDGEHVQRCEPTREHCQR